MKKLLFISAIAMVSLMACDKSENSTDDTVKVSDKTQQALNSRYAGVSNVNWQKRNSYVVATFMLADGRSKAVGVEHEAWFDNEGIWYMTEIDIRFETLPDVIKTTFAASPYAKWTFDDVDMIEREGVETIYIIEVEQGNKEVNLYYSPDGLLIKEMIDIDDDYDYEDYIPTTPSTSIESYIKTTYPNARILEIDKEGRYTEVEILDGKVKLEVIFDGDQWLRTEKEIRLSELPQVVKSAISASKYATYEIDGIEYIETATTQYYRIELEKGDLEASISIKSDGTIMQE